MTNLIQTKPESSFLQPSLEKSEPKPSIELEHIRSNLLSCSRVTDQLPIMDGREVSHLISEYMGSDEEQEKEISLTVGDYISNPEALRLMDALLTSTGVSNIFIRQFPSADSEEMFSALGAKVMDLIDADSSLKSTSLLELQTDNQKKLLLHSIYVDAAIQVIEEYAKKDKDNAIGKLKQNLKKAINREIQHCYGDKTILLKTDREHIASWIKETQTLQQKSKALMDVPVLKNGGNQGITFAIKKNDKVYGYLYGTIHGLSASNSDDLMFLQISSKTQKRLHECAILGTEIRVDLEKLDFEHNPSLDFVLASDAIDHGIANIGIDDELRDYLVDDVESTSSDLELDFVEEVIASTMNALYAGNLDALNQLGSVFQKKPYADLYTSTEKRNKSMADNIDILLGAYEKPTEPIKCFFAVGCFHLIDNPSSPVSLVALLKEKGWALESIKDC